MSEKCSVPVALPFTASGTALVESYKVDFDSAGKYI